MWNIQNFLIFLGAFAFDQITKTFGENLSTIHFNRGFIMGFFSGQPGGIRIVAMGFFAALLFTVYLVLLYLLPKRTVVFKYALSLLMGGLLGNVIDKLLYGFTRDFIPFSFLKFYFIFNFSDVFIWSGALYVLYFVIKKDYLIWYEASTRKHYLLNIPEQMSFSLQLTLLVFNACLLLGVFSFAFVSIHYHLGPKAMVAFGLAILSITVFVCFFTFIAGIVMSHRRLGALYAFELFVNDLLAGKDRPLRLRESDSYQQNLKDLSEKLRIHFQGKIDK
jgi:signal peptidase II